MSQTMSVPRPTKIPNQTATADMPLWRQIDQILVGAVAALASLGLVMIYASNRDALLRDGGDPQKFLKKQLIFVALGVGAMLATLLFDYQNYLEFSPVLYVGSLVLLVGLFAVPAKKGAHGWYDLGLFQLQPAEFTKIVMILVLAAYGSLQRNQFDLRRFVTIILVSAVPIGLIYLQPDLGTALVFLVILFVLLWLSGAESSHLVGLIGLGLASMFLTVKLGILKEYQIKRLTSFLDTSGSERNEAYNVLQSKIAIGSGGLSGKGLFGGTQAKLGYVPERHTDFIFSVVGEQLGLIGGLVVLLLFSIVAWRIWRVAAGASDTAGMLICGGVLALFLFQVFENVGMTMGIMPVTGIPLPFLSYGGSSTIAAFIGVGLVLNVSRSRYR